LTQDDLSKTVGVNVPYDNNGISNPWPKSLVQDIANKNIRVDVYETVAKMVDPVAQRKTANAPVNAWEPFKQSAGIKGVQDYPLEEEKQREAAKKQAAKSEVSNKIEADKKKAAIKLDAPKKLLAQAGDDAKPAAAAGPAGPEKVSNLDPEFYINHANTYWPTPRTTWIAQNDQKLAQAPGASSEYPDKVFHLDPPYYIEHSNTYWPTPRTTFIAQTESRTD
jgi:hypothetical protein